MLAGSYRKDLLAQIFANDSMQVIAEEVTKLKDKQSMRNHCKLRLGELSRELPQNLSFSLDSRMKVKGFIAEECKTMDSKKVPLWIVGENAQDTGDKILVIFKVGDDLRQDQLTL